MLSPDDHAARVVLMRRVEARIEAVTFQVIYIYNHIYII